MVKRICELIKKKGLSISAVEKQLGFGNGAIKRFDKNSPSIDKIISLSAFLNVSIDYLVYGKEYSNASSISNSIVDHSFGTITVGKNEDTNTEVKTQLEQVMSDITKEIVKISESLSIKEQVRLLNLIYDFEENCKKSNT